MGVYSPVSSWVWTGTRRQRGFQLGTGWHSLSRPTLCTFSNTDFGSPSPLTLFMRMSDLNSTWTRNDTHVAVFDVSSFGSCHKRFPQLNRTQPFHQRNIHGNHETEHEKAVDERANDGDRRHGGANVKRVDGVGTRFSLWCWDGVVTRRGG
jgi:hypothetical protein